MPGFPHADSTFRVLRGAERAGVDFVELGVPFSDPLADGPVIQRASQTAIENGITPRAILRLVSEFRKSSSMPIVLMGYINSFINGIGPDFARRVRDSGADGVIIPDLSLEESPDLAKQISAAGISLVLLIAPTSDDARIASISEKSTDFSYCVSITGVTGARKNLVNTEVIGLLERVRKNSRKPFVVGFGISTPQTAKEISNHAAGIVVGSALVQELLSGPAGGEEDSAYRFLYGLRTAIDE